jgi:Zn-dependent M28 family amino/carboxypeptidase
VICSHKDSPSWTDSPGAYDNAVGTAANLELARVLAAEELPVSVWHLFCNEEHTPWTSVTAAQNAKARGDRILAVLNTDSIGGKSQADVDAGRKTNVTGYVTPEGKRLADLMAVVNADYGIGLIQRSFRRESPGDDDGSFVKAGYPAAVINVGSLPYADPYYHAEGDTAAHVDVENVWLSAQAVLAAALTLALA